ncbi:Uma2 family endonuclease [Humisphaera borealis]|uniref:Uma2 family endonuclease n=2 Tax=Humisphaera borealis TaxID=2807512 RepID=A0A7M2WXK1_9BACT|nr:Uma2 family endonuclease [Humisphaera borealis]
MIETGVLAEDEPVELLEGWIIPKMPRDARHDATIELTDEALSARLPTGWRVRVQSAITTDDSEPEPDLAIVRGSPRTRTHHHPGAADIAMLVEVSGTSLLLDRRDKGRLYARAGFSCYWVINLGERQVEVFTLPVAGPEALYRDLKVYAFGDDVPIRIDGMECGTVPVRDLIAD